VKLQLLALNIEKELEEYLLYDLVEEYQLVEQQFADQKLLLVLLMGEMAVLLE
jgi:hypothetical protein